MNKQVDEKTLKLMLNGKIPIDVNTLEQITRCNSLEYVDYFDKLDLSRIKKLPSNAEWNKAFQKRAISFNAFIKLIEDRCRGIGWREHCRQNVNFFYNGNIHKFKFLKNKIKKKLITQIDNNLIESNDTLFNFINQISNNYKEYNFEILNFRKNNFDNLVLRKFKKRSFIKNKSSYHVIPDEISYLLKDLGILPLGRNEVLFRGEILNLSDDLFSGKRPISQSELYYVAMNHNNYDLTNLNTSTITNFEGLFGNTDFNQDISNWDVSAGRNFGWMFSDNIHFDKDLSNWNVSNGYRFKGMFSNTEKINFNFDKWNFKSAETLCAMLDNTKNFTYDFIPNNLNISNMKNDVDLDCFGENDNLIKTSVEIFLCCPENYLLTFSDNENIINIKSAGILYNMDYFNINYIDSPDLRINVKKMMKVGVELIEEFTVKLNVKTFYLHRLPIRCDSIKQENNQSLITIKNKLIKIDGNYYRIKENEFNSLKNSGIFN